MYTVPQNISNVFMTMLYPHFIIICTLKIKDKLNLSRSVIIVSLIYINAN